MRISFRQGLVRYQTDTSHNPTFLQSGSPSIASGVTLNVSPDPTIIAFAQGQSDYLFEEASTITNAWAGPFVSGTDYWLYWDLDILTGIRTFGKTTRLPVFSFNEPTKLPDQHWFDLSITTMKVVVNGRWVEKIRVFAAKLSNGAVLQPYPLGTQVGLNIPVNAGQLMYDDEDNIVKKFDKFGKGKFITTESNLASQISRLSNFKIENSLFAGTAIEYVPEHYCVCFKFPTKLGLASYTTPLTPCIGLASEDMHTSEVRTFITQGYVTDVNWNWTQPPGTRLFVGVAGELSTNVPQDISIQQIAEVVSPTIIYVNIQQIILLEN